MQSLNYRLSNLPLVYFACFFTSTMDLHQRAQYHLTTLHTLGKRAFQIASAADDARVLWRTERLLQDDEIIEVVHGLADLSGSPHYSIHQSVCRPLCYLQSS